MVAGSVRRLVARICLEGGVTVMHMEDLSKHKSTTAFRLYMLGQSAWVLVPMGNTSRLFALPTKRFNG